MQILFIGGTGNISAECAALMHERGHDITVLSRGRDPLPPQYRALRADRKDPAAMRSALADAKAEVVINFLGYELPEVQLDWEILKGRVRQYIFISSATVYAKPPDELPLTETSPVGNPFWDYAQKKLACEQWLQQQADFPVTIVRPSHTYSKRWIPNMVSSSGYSFAARLERGQPVFVHDDGETPWTLTAATDFAMGLGGLAGNERALGEAFHITSDEALTWNQIVAEIAAALDVKSLQTVRIPTNFICEVAPQLTGTLKGDKAHPCVFDNAKIKHFVPDFQCRKPFRIGVRESIGWLRAHPEQQHLNPQVDATIDLVITKWLGR
jgi:nucleoside-diphosphate-sugar epimerase